MMDGQTLVVSLAACHGAALVAGTPATLLKSGVVKRIALGLLTLALILNTWIIVDRWLEASQPPFRTLYETLVFYPWCVAVVTLALIYLHRLYVLIPFASAVSLVGLWYALQHPDVEIMNLPPALQSGWFVPHVVTYFVAYAGLFVSFVLAFLALVVPFWLRRRAGATAAPDVTRKDRFQRHAHQAAVFGLTALTLGLVMGTVWGKFAWGDYWSWDPKENWALTTWLAYMIYMHLRRMDGWRGQRAMWILVFAFAAVVFTYLGMNLLPTSTGSLHVYQ